MKLPKSWAEVTIGQYYQVMSIYNVLKGDWVEAQIKLLALFSGKPQAEIEKLTIANLTRHAAQLSFLGTLPEEKRLAHTFKLKGKTYKAVLLSSGMESGQFMDFTHAGKGCTPEELPYHMHELIAAMCHTRKGNWLRRTWEYEGYSNTAEDFLDMPMTLAYPYYVFFCEVLTNLQQPMLDYSRKVVKKNLRKAERLVSV